MAFLGLRVPHEVARVLGQIEVPGTLVPGDHKHITILMFGKEVPIETISKAVVAVHEVSSKMVPFAVTLDHVACFPKNDDGVPIICPVTSPELLAFHGQLQKALDKAGVEYSKKFPEYKPHVTLSYAPEAVKEQKFGPIDWSVYEVVLWGGDSGDERLSVTFPFALPGKTALWRRLIQANVRLQGT